MTESRCIYCKKTFRGIAGRECESCTMQLRAIVSKIKKKYENAFKLIENR